MSGQEIRETYLEAGEFFAGVVDTIDIDGFEAPALGEWLVRDLIGHTYRAFTTVLSYSAAPAEKVELDSPLAYFLAVLGGDVDHKQVAERGRAAGLEIIDDPKMMVRGFAMYVKNKLGELSDDHIMGTIVGGMRLIDYLPTRTFELIIHTMDLAQALGIKAEPPQRGMETTVQIMGQLAVQRGHAADLVMAATGRRGLPGGFSVLA
ncbi:MAG: maleylpyruvate isomerase N-terminal domain-containing protein [Chloroflexi bacterium]|nr:maleylpyruvate isomerase N-terminal domain-containing protein [Chloroflexota bacterium]MDA1272411.1 maleylpyruvate isomerase N-terminal domain-containing protein [Chloroflexota bacterium]